jgi:hypothetical protein
MNVIKKCMLISTLVISMNTMASTAPVEFQLIPTVMEKFDHAELYQKKSATLGRLPLASELGTDFTTYVSDSKGGYTVETRNKMTNDVVVASMPKPIVEEIYNQWLVPKSTWQKTYGALPTSSEFKSFKRIKTIKAIKIDDEILLLLGSDDGETAVIAVSWDDNGMKVYKNGYLADYEYGIAPEEMKANYELVK